MTQPRLTVRLTSFPESNGKRNWTALLVRVEDWNGLIGNCGNNLFFATSDGFYCPNCGT